MKLRFKFLKLLVKLATFHVELWLFNEPFYFIYSRVQTKATMKETYFKRISTYRIDNADIPNVDNNIKSYQNKINWWRNRCVSNFSWQWPWLSWLKYLSSVKEKSKRLKKIASHFWTTFCGLYRKYGKLICQKKGVAFSRYLMKTKIERSDWKRNYWSKTSKVLDSKRGNQTMKNSKGES